MKIIFSVSEVLQKHLSFLAAIIYLLPIYMPGALAQNVSVAPSSGPGNALVSVSASGFQPDVSGTIWANTGFYVDGGFLAACAPPADQSGWANCTVMFRMVTGSGEHIIRAANSFGAFATTTFTVKPPTLEISPAFGPADTQVSVNGHTFVAAGNVGVYIDDGFTRNEVTDEGGNFSDSIPFSALSAGPHVVKGAAGGDTATAIFTVTNCIGSASSPDGGSTVKHPGGNSQPLPINAPVPVENGDTLQTGPGGSLPLNLADGTGIKLGPGSAASVENYNYDANNGAHNSALYTFLGGAFQYVSGLLPKNSDADVNINTPMGEAGIRGTQLIARRDSCSLTQEIYLIEGAITISPAGLSGVTNIYQAPISIYFTSNSITTNALTAALFQSISNQIFITNTIVTLGSWLDYHFGCTNGNAAAAPDADPDGDGVSNAAEFLANTDPTRSASVFHMLSARSEGDGLRLTWLGGGGRTNILQSATAPGSGWIDRATNVLAVGGDVTTNYLDAGTLTNHAAKFYRVRLP